MRGLPNHHWEIAGLDSSPNRTLEKVVVVDLSCDSLSSAGEEPNPENHPTTPSSLQNSFSSLGKRCGVGQHSPSSIPLSLRSAKDKRRPSWHARMSRINGSSSSVSSPLTYILNLLKMAFAGSSFHLFQLPGRRPTHSLSVVILIHNPRPRNLPSCFFPTLSSSSA